MRGSPALPCPQALHGPHWPQGRYLSLPLVFLSRTWHQDQASVALFSTVLPTYSAPVKQAAPTAKDQKRSAPGGANPFKPSRLLLFLLISPVEQGSCRHHYQRSQDESGCRVVLEPNAYYRHGHLHQPFRASRPLFLHRRGSPKRCIQNRLPCLFYHLGRRALSRLRRHPLLFPGFRPLQFPLRNFPMR